MPHTNLRDILIAEMADALGADRLMLRTWPALARGVRTQSLKRLCEEGVDYTRNESIAWRRPLRSSRSRRPR